MTVRLAELNAPLRSAVRRPPHCGCESSVPVAHAGRRDPCSVQGHSEDRCGDSSAVQGPARPAGARAPVCPDTYSSRIKRPPTECTESPAREAVRCIFVKWVVRKRPLHLLRARFELGTKFSAQPHFLVTAVVGLMVVARNRSPDRVRGAVRAQRGGQEATAGRRAPGPAPVPASLGGLGGRLPCLILDV